MRVIPIMMLLFLTGCSTVQIPNYIKADHPYIRRVYGSFDQVSTAVKAVLAQEGFKVEKETAPDVYERDSRDQQEGAKGSLVLTDVKQYSRILYSSYVHLNVYLRQLADGVEVEIRYGKVTTVLFRQLKGTRNDGYARRLLDRIEAQLNNQ